MRAWPPDCAVPLAFWLAAVFDGGVPLQAALSFRADNAGPLETFRSIQADGQIPWKAKRTLTTDARVAPRLCRAPGVLARGGFRRRRPAASRGELPRR